MSRHPKSHTETIRKRYDRISFLYNLMEWPMERLRFSSWRARLTERIIGPRVLEAGVGTGKNIPYYPAGVAVTAVDFSRGMLAKAERKAERRPRQVDLLHMDVQHLNFADAAFDTVFATFVFCSVPDPVQGLKELRRVCKPGGKLLLLEHMRPENFLFGLLFDAFNPITVRLSGANINRRTVDNVKNAGWQITKIENLSADIVRWIEADN